MGFEISEGIDIPAGQYEFEQFCIYAGSADHRKVSVKADYCGGEFFDGDQTAAGAELLWRPTPHFKFAARYRFNEIELPNGAFVIFKG